MSLGGESAAGLSAALLAALLGSSVASAQSAVYPFKEDFESGAFGPEWGITTTFHGYALHSVDHGPHSGARHVVMASWTNGVESSASLDLTIDLLNQERVLLEFFHKEFGDEDNPEDGVFISADGQQWHLVLSLQDASSDWTKKIVNLDEACQAIGLSYNSQFRIRFQWKDNFNLPTDGFAFDDIHVRPLDFTVLQTLHGDAPGDEMGRSLALLGDQDGDGTLEVMIGAPQADALAPGDDLGTARIVSGKTGVSLQEFVGFSPGARFASALASPGDVDGDGAQDFLIGAPESDLVSADAGAAYLYSGASKLLLSGFSSPGAGNLLGYSVCGPGDLDGDGVPDLAIGSPGADEGGSASGRVATFSGATYQPIFSVMGDSGDQLGYSLSGISDWDFDGFPDLLVGAPFDDLAGVGDSGSVRLVSGASGLELALLGGQSPGEGFGLSARGVGDLNLDGRGDLVVGAPFNDDGGLDAGKLYVYLSPDIAPTAQLIFDTPGGALGWDVSGVGDLDADGVPDFLAGAPRRAGNLPGSARLYSGADYSVLRTFWGGNAGGRFGSAVCSAGDVNADGIGDMAIGAPLEIGPASQGGSVRFLTSLTAPYISDASGLLSAETGEVIVTGDNFMGDVVVRYDGQAVALASLKNTELRFVLPPSDPGIFPLEVETLLGSAAWTQGVPRFPALSSSAGILGKDMTVRVQNGSDGACILFASPFLFPNLAVFPGWSYGMWLQFAVPLGLSQTAAPGFDSHKTIALPADPAFEGVTVFLQAFAVQGLPPQNTAGFTNMVPVVFEIAQ